MEQGYSICFNEWALDKDIKNELGLLVIISSLCAEKGYCYASNKYLAELFNISEVSVSRKISLLEEKGYITIEYEKRGCEVKNRYIRLTKLLTDGYQKCYSTINKNVKENNISINNTSLKYTNNSETKNLFEIIEENFGRLLSPLDYEEVSLWEDNELTRYAIKTAVTGNKCNVRYISRILDSYKRNNIKTVQQAQEQEEEFLKRKENKQYGNKKSTSQETLERWRKEIEEARSNGIID